VDGLRPALRPLSEGMTLKEVGANAGPNNCSSPFVDSTMMVGLEESGSSYHIFSIFLLLANSIETYSQTRCCDAVRFGPFKVEDDTCIFVCSSVELSHGARDFRL
jgi:hypothetical protein